MEFRLLGALSVLGDGVPVAVTGVNQRAALAHLLLHDNQVVTTDALVTSVWGTEVPRTARKMLHNAVSGLRRTLAPDPDVVLLTRDPGYLLQVDPERIDVHRFRALAGAGRAELACGTPAAAARTLRSAFRLWRGAPLADLVELGFRWPELDQLREGRSTALADCLEAELACGRHLAVLVELRVVVAEEPLSERACGLLMLAEYRCGRPDAAVRAYDALRTRLVEHDGAEPGAPLRDLERDILDGAEVLQPPRPVQDRVVVDGARAVAAPAITECDVTGVLSTGVLEGFRTRLLTHVDSGPTTVGRRAQGGSGPAPRPPFVGRAFELELLGGVESRVRATGVPALVLVSGEQGMGKTMLLREWLASVEDAHVLHTTVAARQPAVEVLAELVGDHAAGVGSVDACVRAVALLAGSAPTVVVVEDLEHADDDLLAAIARIADGPGPVLVALSARPRFAVHRPGWESQRRNALFVVLDWLSEATAGPSAAGAPQAAHPDRGLDLFRPATSGPATGPGDPAAEAALRFATALELWPATTYY